MAGIDQGATGYPQDQDRGNSSPSSTAESGSSSEGEMSVWSDPRVDRLDTLGRAAWVNNSSYTTKGISSTYRVLTGAYPNDIPTGDRPLNSTPTKAEDGPSANNAGEMAVWSDDRLSRLDKVGRAPWTNQSSYTTKGVSGTTPNKYPNDIPTGDRPLNPTPLDGETGASAGEAGNMAIWTDTRVNRLQTLIGGPMTNEASFNIGPGMAGSSPNGYPNGLKAADQGMGAFVEGTFLDVDGAPLSGSIYFAVDGDAQGKASTDGQVQAAGPPMDAISAGSDGSQSSTYDFFFEPSIAGVLYEDTDIPANYNIGTVQYGEAYGKVTDFNGEPLKNVAVAGLGASAISDEFGDYTLLAPGGQTVQLTSIYGTYTFDVDYVAGDSKEFNVRFPQLTIKVLDAEYEPVGGAPVKIDATTYQTGDNGKVEIPDAEVKGDYSVTVQDFFEATDISVANPDEEFVYEVGPGSSFGDYASLSIGGVKIIAVDADTGRPIKEIKAADKADGASSLSTDDGTVKILSDSPGEEIEVVVGTGDPRYLSETLTGTLPEADQNDMLEYDVELDSQTQVSNL